MSLRHTAPLRFESARGYALTFAVALLLVGCNSPKDELLSAGDPNAGLGAKRDTSASAPPSSAKSPTTFTSASSAVPTATDGSLSAQPGTSAASPAEPGTLPTQSSKGKQQFASTIAPWVESQCGGCHAPGGIGTPTWVRPGDPGATYDLIYLNGYATATSRIVTKGIHAGGSAPELSAANKTAWAEWIAVETADGAATSQQSVLEKIGTCFDKSKFDAIGFGNLRTIRRTRDNNPNQQSENADTCTGCDNVPCRTCHAADDATGFIMAIGNPVFDESYTFEQSKRLSPPFIRQYVATTPTGEPVFNPALQAKSSHTINVARAYSHPMYSLSSTMQAAIKAFVEDAIAKHKLGICPP